MRKEHKYLLLVVILLSIAVGYAFLNVDLKINGTADVKNTKWNVHFENYQRTYNSTVVPISEPEIEGDTTTEISYEVSFLEPGDYYEFTVDISNSGNLHASIDSLETTVFDGDNELSGIPNYIDYSITYVNGDNYVLPHEIQARRKETIVVGVYFKRDITSAQYEEATGKTLHFNTKINFVQADYSGTPVYVYTNSSDLIYIGEDFPQDVTFYDDYQDIDTRVFLRHKLVRGVVKETDLGYNYGGDIVFIPSFNPDNADEISRTTEAMLSAFGSDNCSEQAGNFFCFDVFAYIDKGLEAKYDGFICAIHDMYSACS